MTSGLICTTIATCLQPYPDPQDTKRHGWLAGESMRMADHTPLLVCGATVSRSQAAQLRPRLCLFAT